jgi:hypothetical protein
VAMSTSWQRTLPTVGAKHWRGVCGLVAWVMAPMLRLYCRLLRAVSPPSQRQTVVEARLLRRVKRLAKTNGGWGGIASARLVMTEVGLSLRAWQCGALPAKQSRACQHVPVRYSEPAKYFVLGSGLLLRCRTPFGPPRKDKWRLGRDCFAQQRGLGSQ